MSDLILHGKSVHTVFHLLGRNENDMTRAMGWGVSRCSAFLELLTDEIVPKRSRTENMSVALQVWEKPKGFTDIEIIGGSKFHLIVEAKRGWQPPEMQQLQKYAARLQSSKADFKSLVVLTDWSYVAMAAAIRSVSSIPVAWISWAKVRSIAAAAKHRSGIKARLWLDELISYLGGVTTMQEPDSNWVYVVSLGAQTPDGWKISFIDVVRKHGLYFHPTEGGGGWPKTPPNYLGWRYGGKLQGIAHIEEFRLVPDMHDEIPEIPRGKVKDHVLYRLGPVFKPSKEVRVGKLFKNSRVKCMLDTLFTSNTISEARDESQKRIKRAENAG
jgi:hypothetical protein